MVRSQRSLKAKVFIGITLVFSVLFLSGCLRESVPEVKHGYVAGTPVELEPGMTFGQSFRATNNNLYRVDIYCIFNNGGSGPSVYFHLKEMPTAGRDLIVMELDSCGEETGLVTARFPPIADSAGRSYYFYLDAPKAQNSPITLFLAQEDSYLEGSAHQNGEPVDGDLLFAAYTEDLYTPGRVFNDFLGRASQDKPFFIFYLTLISLVLLALGLVLRWTPRRSHDQ